MKRTTVWLFITFLTFAIGVMAVFLYLKFNSSNNQGPDTSTDYTIPNNRNEAAEIPTLTLCELSSDPQKYDEKIVRLNTTLYSSNEGKFLMDRTCKTSKGVADPAKPYVENDEVWKPIVESGEPKEPMRWTSEIYLTVVGKFKNEAPKDGYLIPKFQFEILQIEKVLGSNREFMESRIKSMLIKRALKRTLFDTVKV